MPFPRIVSPLALLFLVAACGPNIPPQNGGGENGNGDTLDPSWPTVADTFSESCASTGCHGPGALILELVGESAYEEIVNVPSEQVPALLRVEPGDPDYSYLFLKIIGLHQEGCEDAGVSVDQCGTQMPPPPTPQLPQERIRAVEGWIANGATREG